MRSIIRLTIAGAFIALGTGNAFAQLPVGTESVALHPPLERDYLVESGKRPVYASERLRQAHRHQPFVSSHPSSGQFVQRGKAIVWVPNELLPVAVPRTPQVAVAESKRSRGQFVQRGKAIFWQETDQ